MTKPTKLPTYNPKRDGNRFQWVLRAAEDVRQQRLRDRRAEYLRNHTTARPILPIQRPPFEGEH